MKSRLIIKKVKRNLNDFGVCCVFSKGAKYLFKSVYVRRNYRMYRRDLSGESFPDNVPENVSIRLLTVKDIDAINQIEDMEEWLHGRLQGILQEGLCVAAFVGPQVVGFNLIVFHNTHITLLNLDKRLLPHEAWSEQITVSKNYRKQQLASALRYRVFSELQKRGIQTLYGGTLISNIPSLRLAEKVGFQTVADVEYVKILNHERHLWKKYNHVPHRED